jgi:hypothetical protein
MTLVVVVVAVVVAVATYLTWLARRLDRLGLRVAAARAGLVAQLVVRADVAGRLAASRALAPLTAAAEQSTAGHQALRAGAPLDTAVEETENQLSRALRAPEVAASGQGAQDLLHAVDSAAARVALARQLHNDAVRDLRALRGRRLVRLLRLGGRRPLPAYFEIDDALPGRTEADRASTVPVVPVPETTVPGATVPGATVPGAAGPEAATEGVPRRRATAEEIIGGLPGSRPTTAA